MVEQAPTKDPSDAVAHGERQNEKKSHQETRYSRRKASEVGTTIKDMKESQTC